MDYGNSTKDLVKSDDDDFFGSSLLAANQCARELSHHGKVPDDPVTPVTPLVPSTPMLAAHIYGQSSMIGDLELAANLGKALLLANRKLEGEVKENEIIIDEQSQEIAYLTKQTSALREANESRLKIYEQLEISIQDLEETNKRFKSENLTERKKTKVLVDTIEQLETKCDQLYKDLVDSVEKRGRSRNKCHAKDERYRRSLSCENSLQVPVLTNDEDLRTRLTELESKFDDAQAQRILEVRKREDYEVELACATQESELLREQLAVFKEREDVLKSIDEEFSTIDDTSSGFCRKCNNLLETASNHTLQDMDDIEEDDINDIRGPCSLFRLKNGGFAYGSHESLVSLGRMLNRSEESSPSSVAQTESQPNSLFSELNVEYWSAMNKCEKLIKERECHNSLTMDVGPCIRCPTCTCHSRQDLGPKSILEEFSEVESASSGFSDENKNASKSTQTDDNIEDITPTVSYKPIIDTSEISSSTEALPEYRKILHQVYYNIKQIVDHDKLSGFKQKNSKKENISDQLNTPEGVDDGKTDGEIPPMSCETDRPQRPNFLEIDSSSSNRQKRRKRSKKSPLSVKYEDSASNNTAATSELFQQVSPEPKHDAPITESPKANNTVRRDKPRSGCPHKVRNKTKFKTRVIDKKPTTESSAENVKISHPSVEVAKLRKLDMTYAEALKNANRRSNVRK